MLGLTGANGDVATDGLTAFVAVYAVEGVLPPVAEEFPPYPANKFTCPGRSTELVFVGSPLYASAPGV